MADDRQLLEQLATRMTLRDLSLRYARGVDRRDEPLFASVFHSDATVDFGNVYAGPADKFVSMQKELLADYELTAHYLINSLYAINGDTANGEIYFLAYHRTATAAAQVVTVGGRYLDEYARDEGNWKILRRHVAWDHVTTTDVSLADQNALTNLGRVGSHLDDPSYNMLQNYV